MCAPYTSQRKAIIHLGWTETNLVTFRHHQKTLTQLLNQPNQNRNINRPLCCYHFVALLSNSAESLFSSKGSLTMKGLERTDCEALTCHSPCHVSRPLFTCYLAWHFCHNHFGLSHSVLWEPDVCWGSIFLSIHTVLIKIKNPYLLCVCVCVLDVPVRNPRGHG